MSRDTDITDPADAREALSRGDFATAAPAIDAAADFDADAYTDVAAAHRARSPATA